MKIWLTTDTHFSHERIKQMGRPSDYEDKIKKNLKRLVSKYDLLIHLGDVCLGKDKANNNWFKKNLRCRTLLIIGNHDHKGVGWYLDNGWDFVCDSFSLKYYGKKIVFSHIPMMYDNTRFDLNVHGHLHENRHRGDCKAFNFKERDYSLVSLEFSDYQPILLETLIKKL